MIPRLFAATGAVILWAYARACRDRNATQRRLSRANLLRQVSARPTRCADCGRADSRGDRVVTIDITPDTDHLEQILSDDVLGWQRDLTGWQREFLRRSLTGRPITYRDVEIPPARTARQGGYIPGTQPVEMARGEITLRPDDATREAVTKALHDACGEWWREDSGDRYPGRGGW